MVDAQHVRHKLTDEVVADLVKHGCDLGFAGDTSAMAWYQFFKTFGFSAQAIADALQRYQFNPRGPTEVILEVIGKYAKEQAEYEKVERFLKGP